MDYPQSIKLTPKQEKLFLKYQDKWRRIALSTERIDRNKAAAAIKAGYSFINEKEPEIFFYDSPYGASIKLDDGRLRGELEGEALLPNLYRKSVTNLFDSDLWNQIDKMRELLYIDMDDKLEKNAGVFLESSFEPGYWQTDYCCSYCAFPDFYINEYGIKNNLIDLEAWNIFKEILISCGLIAAYEEVCVICDRPTQLLFDEQNLLHAEGKPAVEYADGYKLYAYHGAAIPEKYGILKPSEWKSEWLLTEKNPFVKQVLVEVLDKQ